MKGPAVCSTLLAAALLFASFELQARATECHTGKDIKVIEVRSPTADQAIACKAIYHTFNRNKPSKTVWIARSDVDFCSTKAQLYISRLQSAGWHCAAVYQPAEDNEVIQSSFSVDDNTNAEVPRSPLGFRKFLEEQFEIDFQTRTDYYYGLGKTQCIARECKKIFDYLSRTEEQPLSMFGYKVSGYITLWIAPQCRGRQCWGELYQQQQTNIKKLTLPAFQTESASSVFLTSQRQGFPDLWLPIEHSSSRVAEVKIFRYDKNGYTLLAHLLAEADATGSAASAVEPGIVTLKASRGEESLKLSYRTRDIKNEALLFSPSS